MMKIIHALVIGDKASHDNLLKSVEPCQQNIPYADESFTVYLHNTTGPAVIFNFRNSHQTQHTFLPTPDICIFAAQSDAALRDAISKYAIHPHMAVAYLDAATLSNINGEAFLQGCINEYLNKNKSDAPLKSLETFLANFHQFLDVQHHRHKRKMHFEDLNPQATFDRNRERLNN
jgi:hypothetical protein